MFGYTVGTLILFFLIIFIANTLESITGFGSTALSLPFLSVLLGVETAKPILTMYTLLLCVYVLAREHRNVDWKNYGKMMLALLFGLPIGILIYNVVSRKVLMGVLSVFMIVVSIRGLLICFGKLKQSRSVNDKLLLFFVFLGGIMHGAFSSGGPLIILYSTEKIKEKSRFRATMCMIWLTLNTIIVTQMAASSQINPSILKTAAIGIPCIIFGTLLGDFAHKRIDNAFFTKLTYTVLLISGIFMAVKL